MKIWIQQQTMSTAVGLMLCGCFICMSGFVLRAAQVAGALA